MGFRYLAIAAAIQLVVFFLPIAAGVAGLISGGVAGLTAVLGWFVAGIPASYAVVDTFAARNARGRKRALVSAAPAAGIPTATPS